MASGDFYLREKMRLMEVEAKRKLELERAKMEEENRRREEAREREEEERRRREEERRQKEEQDRRDRAIEIALQTTETPPTEVKEEVI